MSLKFTERFKKVLIRIDYNKISNYLLNVKSGEFDHNYIDVSDRNSLVSFTPKSKIDSIIEKLPRLFKTTSVRNLTHSDANDHIFKLLGYDKSKNPYWYPESEHTKGIIVNECTSPTTEREYALFQCIDSKRLSVINKVALKEEDNTDIIFTKNRNTIKIGRLVNSLLTISGVEFTSKDIEEFVNLYKSSYDFIDNKGIQFDIASGDDIAKWYNERNYESGGGILNNSCMATKDDMYFELYTKNPNQCSLVILYSDDGHLKDGKYKSDKIKGRALLWDIKHNGKSFKFMDRVYTTHDSDSELFKNWAIENGWLYKQSQTMYPDTHINVTKGIDIDSKSRNGEDVVDGNIMVDLDNPCPEFYPYLDTLCYWVDGCLTNDSELHHSKELRTVHGGYISIDEDGERNEVYGEEEVE